MQQTLEILVTRFPHGYIPFIYFVRLDPARNIRSERLYALLELWRQYLFSDPVIRGKKHGVSLSIPLSQVYPQIYHDLLGEATRLLEAVRSCIHSGSIPILIDSKSRIPIESETARAALILECLRLPDPRFHLTFWLESDMWKWCRANAPVPPHRSLEH